MFFFKNKNAAAAGLWKESVPQPRWLLIFLRTKQLTLGGQIR
jgi:hypothetical protein